MLFIGTQLSYSNDLLELVRTDIKAERKVILAENMELTDEQSEVFWKIFRDYEYDMSKIGDKVVANITEYADNYENLTDEKADEILKNSFNNQEEEFATLKKYTKKIAKELGGKVAARFYQLETMLGLVIDIQVMGAIPLAE